LDFHLEDSDLTRIVTLDPQSVGFTGVAGIILALLWFISFGLALVVHYCCGWKINIRDGERHFSERICLIVLIILTCAAA